MITSMVQTLRILARPRQAWRILSAQTLQLAEESLGLARQQRRNGESAAAVLSAVRSAMAASRSMRTVATEAVVRVPGSNDTSADALAAEARQAEHNPDAAGLLRRLADVRRGTAYERIDDTEAGRAIEVAEQLLVLARSCRSQKTG